MLADRGVLAESRGHGAYCRPQLHPHTLRQAQPERPGTGSVCRVGKPNPDMSPVTFRRSIPLSIHITYPASLCSSVGVFVTVVRDLIHFYFSSLSSNHSND